MKQPELTPEETARRMVMVGVHHFCAEVITLCGPDSQVGVCARRIAQRTRVQLIERKDPNLEEIRDAVAASILARRERIATLLEK